MPIYSKIVLQLFEKFSVKGAAHITGGGIAGNLVRALHDGVDAVVHTRSWPIPKLFRALQEWGEVPEDELWEVFNMGLGFMLILPEGQAQEALRFLEGQGERAYPVGEIVPGRGQVVLR
jgi:phosphoribosylformylglycinamidine cyclo-ligase